MPLDGCLWLRYVEDMKNFFDIATPRELKECFGSIPKGKYLAFDRESYDLDKDLNFLQLHLLYLGRGDTANAEYCYEQIASPERRLEAGMLVGECREA